MDTLVDHHGKFVRYSLWCTKPVQTIKQWYDVVIYDVVISTGLVDESSRCIHDCLEMIWLERQYTGQCSISEVELCQHQCGN